MRRWWMAMAFASTLAPSAAWAIEVAPRSRHAMCGHNLKVVMRRSYHASGSAGVTSRRISPFGEPVFMRILLVVGLLLCVSAAHADQLDTIKKKGDLVCGVLGTDEPNSFVDPKTRTIIGYEVDLCKAI